MYNKRMVYIQFILIFLLTSKVNPIKNGVKSHKITLNLTMNPQCPRTLVMFVCVCVCEGKMAPLRTKNTFLNRTL